MSISEQQLDKYIQKVIDTEVKIEDLDKVIRRLTNSSEELARMHERIDTTQFAMKEIEKTIQATGARIVEIRKDIGEIHAVNAAMQKEMKELPAKMSIPQPVIDGLKHEIDELKKRLAIPLEQQVVHHHHLEEWWIFTFIFLCGTIGFFFLLFKR
jgi:peptidoglycan hydrolase CwlO-like protein